MSSLRLQSFPIIKEGEVEQILQLNGFNSGKTAVKVNGMGHMQGRPDLAVTEPESVLCFCAAQEAC